MNRTATARAQPTGGASARDGIAERVRHTPLGRRRRTFLHERGHTVGDAEPVTERVHHNSWSANLEGPAHADDRELVVAEAVDAVAHTAGGYHVNLVTHGDHGHPESYLFDALEDAFGDDASVAYVDQCGCGGHVTRVHVRD